MFRITIEETKDDPIVEAGKEYEKVYEQTLETIDLPKLIAAINAKARKPRAKKGTPA